MEYSLKTLNKNSKLNLLTLNEIINQLNLIGTKFQQRINSTSTFNGQIEFSTQV